MEVSLNQIADKQCSYGQFMMPIEQSLQALIPQLASQLPTGLQGFKKSGQTCL